MKITLASIIGYLFGIIAILLGLLFMFTNIISGAALVLAGLLALPAFRRRLRASANIEFSRWAMVGVIVLLTVVSVAVLGATAPSSTADAENNGTTTETQENTETRTPTPEAAGTTSEPTADATATPSPATSQSASGLRMTAVDASVSDPVTSLNIRWNAQTQPSVDPDTGDSTAYYAEDGRTFLVVRMQIENTGEEQVELTPRLFRVVFDGVEYSNQQLFGSSSGGLSQVALQPDGEYEGWVVFSIPTEASQGEIIVNQDVLIGQISVSFEHASDMSIDVATG